MGSPRERRCVWGIRTAPLIDLRKETTHMFKRIRHRLDGNNEQGFTLIELLVVIIIIGILLAIAVPSYLGFRDRAAKSAAQANVRSATPAVEAYFADKGTYVGMTRAELLLIDSAVKLDEDPAPVTATSYCIQSTVGGHVARKNGPAAVVELAACP
jgi:prepilin-type N-terminal cleavage/methylation domain-containing protein